MKMVTKPLSYDQFELSIWVNDLVAPLLAVLASGDLYIH